MCSNVFLSVKDEGEFLLFRVQNFTQILLFQRERDELHKDIDVFNVFLPLKDDGELLLLWCKNSSIIWSLRELNRRKDIDVNSMCSCHLKWWTSCGMQKFTLNLLFQREMNCRKTLRRCAYSSLELLAALISIHACRLAGGSNMQTFTSW